MTTPCRPAPSHEPAQLANAVLPEDEIMKVFNDLLIEDPGVASEARHAAREMRDLPFDELDLKPVDLAQRRATVTGKVGRRAPANPFHSPRLGKWRQGPKTDPSKVDDPALRNNPLRGRLIVNIAVNAALLFVFFQS